jgi:hypothetical protein
VQYLPYALTKEVKILKKVAAIPFRATIAINRKISLLLPG